jgi:hypothetical protein
MLELLTDGKRQEIEAQGHNISI